jgi:hypothetical protein
MKAHDEERVKELLRLALKPMEGELEPSRDLWPAVLKRLSAGTAQVPWFDWALLAGLLGLGAFFPGSIPVFLYYL